MPGKKISVVVPVFNEESNVAVLHQHLSQVFLLLPQYSWNIVFVDDGSRDHSWNLLERLAAEDGRVEALRLSRNFGKEIALTAGVHHVATADAVICIDADLQHPPELIPDLVAQWEKGADVVVTVRKSNEKSPWLRKFGSVLFYWLMSKMSGLDMRSQTTDFRLFDRVVVTAFCRITERRRMFRGVMDWLGFEKAYVEFDASPRNSGVAGYSYAKLWRLAVDSLTSFSLLPLKLTGYIGGVITLLSGVSLAWMLFSRWFVDVLSFSPLAIVVVANTFLIGIVLSAIGLVAMYIGNIHTEVINRPLYVVRKVLSGSGDVSNSSGATD